jgi:hypothetical protein
MGMRANSRVYPPKKNLIIKAERKKNRISYKPFSEEARKKYIDTIENGQHDTRPAASTEHTKGGPSKSYNNRGSVRAGT